MFKKQNKLKSTRKYLNIFVKKHIAGLRQVFTVSKLSTLFLCVSIIKERKGYYTIKFLLLFQLTVMNELGSPTDPNFGNIARVKFTVRHAGQYRISVTVGAQHVAGSPFTAVFIAGPIFAQRTVVLRHCSTVVCTVNITHSLFIEPRDEYNNFCRYSTADDPTKVSHFFLFTLLNKFTSSSKIGM